MVIKPTNQLRVVCAPTCVKRSWSIDLRTKYDSIQILKHPVCLNDFSKKAANFRSDEVLTLKQVHNYFVGIN